MDLPVLVAIGFTAGLVAGLFGVGGGILFVPALVHFGDLAQIEAQATSLVAIIPVAVVGTWRQHRYGNLHLREGLLVGALASAGAFGGVGIANVLPERVLKVGFAGLLLLTAYQLVRGEPKGET
jgi:uncharacterized membrane protein YfcA